MASQSPSPDKNPTGVLRQLALAMELPFVMIAEVLVGGGIGYLLDRLFHSSPVLTLIGGAIGFAAGIWDIIRRLSREEKKQGKGNGAS
jgi:F0F1-type ATP synthase assembly protein I